LDLPITTTNQVYRGTNNFLLLKHYHHTPLTVSFHDNLGKPVKNVKPSWILLQQEMTGQRWQALLVTVQIRK